MIMPTPKKKDRKSKEKRKEDKQKSMAIGAMGVDESVDDMDVPS